MSSRRAFCCQGVEPLPTIPVAVAELEHGDDEDRTIQLPAEWVICSTCSGSGGHSLRFGAITQRDREEDWDEDSFADYMAGRYDEKCEPCEGTGKVLIVNREACRSAEQIAALAKLDSDAEIDAEIEAEHRAEMRYCYGPDAY